MATRACPACGEQIQRAAVLCRFCKTAVPRIEETSAIIKYGGAFVFLIVVVAGIGFVVSAAGDGTSTPIGALPPTQSPADGLLAEVECSGAPGGVSCAVKHVAGPPLHVCFDMVIECSGGVRSVGHACQNVAPGATSARVIHYEDFTNGAKCRSVDSSSVDNLVVTRQ